jgi:hypothetical protein
MRARTLIAGLLIFAVIGTTTAAGARTRASQEVETPVETNETPKLTPDEELEARLIAEQFTSRFEGEDDPLSIVDDLYIRDFNERLRLNVADRFIVPVDSELALQVKGDELRRYHIAALKFFYLYILMGRASYLAQHPKGSLEPEDSEKEFDPVEVLPPRAVEVLKNDPAFAEMILESSKKSAEASHEQEPQGAAEQINQKVEAEDQTIRDMKRLRGLVSVMEQAVSVMREHLQTLPPPKTWQGLVDSMLTPGQEPPPDMLRPRALTLTREDMGFPAGTRLICVDVLLFRMELVRVDGQLRILNVYVSDD